MRGHLLLDAEWERPASARPGICNSELMDVVALLPQELFEVLFSGAMIPGCRPVLGLTPDAVASGSSRQLTSSRGSPDRECGRGRLFCAL